MRHHHERFDGTGYPDRVAGDSIPLASRILAVADAYVAMTEDRPYRRARPRFEVDREFHSCSGTQFDPSVVRSLREVVARRGERLSGRRGSAGGVARGPTADRSSVSVIASTRNDVARGGVGIGAVQVHVDPPAGRPPRDGHAQLPVLVGGGVHRQVRVGGQLAVGSRSRIEMQTFSPSLPSLALTQALAVYTRPSREESTRVGEVVDRVLVRGPLACHPRDVLAVRERPLPARARSSS